MNIIRKNLFSLLGLLVAVCALVGCAGRSPVIPGMVIHYDRSRPPIQRGEPGYDTTLQVRWLGTTCYELQLGDTVVFTDPFLTHQSLMRVALGGTLKSDPLTVSNRLSSLPVPQAIFIGHSHYDHLLDLAECLKQPGWSNAPVYASTSTRNILSSYGDEFTNTWRPVVTNEAWQQVSPGIRYQAIAATHGRQLPFFPLLFSGDVNRPLLPSERRAGKFKVGETYAFVLELSNQRATNSIYFIGAPHRHEEGFPDESIRTVDIAILCVPTWELAESCPTNIIDRLKPRYIVASHFDNFFQVNRKPAQTVALADMEGFLIRAQHCANYEGFQDILVPAVGSVMFFPSAMPTPQ